MKEEEGLVIKVNLADGTATVKVGKHDECSACGACAGSRQLTVEAVNGPGAALGQRVKFRMQEQHMLKGAFIVFILPLLMAGMGAYLGWSLFDDGGPGSGLYVSSTGIIGFVLGAAFVKWYDRRASMRQKEQPVITEIIY